MENVTTSVKGSDDDMDEETRTAQWLQMLPTLLTALLTAHI
jgi:hypothetical protein